MRLAAGCVLVLALASCGTESKPTSTAVSTTTSTTVAVVESTDGDCPQIVAVELTQAAAGVFNVNTTVRSIDVEGVSYADAWEVRDLGGRVLGERILTHPHTNEQPFTRSLSGVAIAPMIVEVEVIARDSVRGFCGPSLIVDVPHS